MKVEKILLAAVLLLISIASMNTVPSIHEIDEQHPFVQETDKLIENQEIDLALPANYPDNYTRVEWEHVTENRNWSESWSESQWEYAPIIKWYTKNGTKFHRWNDTIDIGGWFDFIVEVPHSSIGSHEPYAIVFQSILLNITELAKTGGEPSKENTTGFMGVYVFSEDRWMVYSSKNMSLDTGPPMETPPPGLTLDMVYGTPKEPFLEMNTTADKITNGTDTIWLKFRIKFNATATPGFYGIFAAVIDNHLEPIASSPESDTSGRLLDYTFDELIKDATGGYYHWSRLDDDGNTLLSATRGVDFNMTATIVNGTSLGNVTLIMTLPNKIRTERFLGGMFPETETIDGGWIYNASAKTYIWNGSLQVSHTELRFSFKVVDDFIFIDAGFPYKYNEPWWNEDHWEWIEVDGFSWLLEAVVYSYEHENFTTMLAHSYTYFEFIEELGNPMGGYFEERQGFNIFPMPEEFDFPIPYIVNNETSSVTSLNGQQVITFRGHINENVSPTGVDSPPLYVAPVILDSLGREIYPFAMLPLATSAEQIAFQQLNQLAVESPVAVVRLEHKGEKYKISEMFHTDIGQTFTVKSRLQGGASYADDIDGIMFYLNSFDYDWGEEESQEWSQSSDVEVQVRISAQSEISVTVFNYTMRTTWGYGEHIEWMWVEVFPGHWEWREELVKNWHWQELWWDFTSNDWTDEWFPRYDNKSIMNVDYLKVGNITYDEIGNDIRVWFDITPQSDIPPREWDWNLFFGNLTWVTDYASGEGEHTVLGWVEETVFHYWNGTDKVYIEEPMRNSIFRNLNSTELYTQESVPFISINGTKHDIKSYTFIEGEFGYGEERVVYERWDPDAYDETTGTYSGAMKYWFTLKNGTKVPIYSGRTGFVYNITLPNGKNFTAFSNETMIRWYPGDYAIRAINGTTISGDDTFWMGYTSDTISKFPVSEVGLVMYAVNYSTNETVPIYLATYPEPIDEGIHLIYLNDTFEQVVVQHIQDDIHACQIGSNIYVFNGFHVQRAFIGKYNAKRVIVGEAVTRFRAYTIVNSTKFQLPYPGAEVWDMYDLNYKVPRRTYAFIDGQRYEAKYIGHFWNVTDEYMYPVFQADVMGTKYNLTYHTSKHLVLLMELIHPESGTNNPPPGWEPFTATANGSIHVPEMLFDGWTLAYGSRNPDTWELDIEGWFNVSSGVYKHPNNGTTFVYTNGTGQYVILDDGQSMNVTMKKRILFFRVTLENGTFFYTSLPELQEVGFHNDTTNQYEVEYYFMTNIAGGEERWYEWSDFSVEIVNSSIVDEILGMFEFEGFLYPFRNTTFNWETQWMATQDAYVVLLNKTGYEFEIATPWPEEKFYDKYCIPRFNFTLDGSTIYNVSGAREMIYKAYKTWGYKKKLDLVPLPISLQRSQYSIIIGTPKWGMWDVDTWTIDKETGALDLDGNLDTKNDQYYVRSSHSATEYFNVTEEFLFVSIYWEPDSTIWGDEFVLNSFTGMVTVNWTAYWEDKHIWYNASTGEPLTAAEWDVVNATLFDSNGIPKPGYWSIAWLGENFTSVDLKAQAQEEGWDWAIQDSQIWSWLWWRLDESYVAEVNNGTHTQPVWVNIAYEYAGMLAWNDTNSNNLMDVDPVNPGSAELTHYWMPIQVTSANFTTPGESWGNLNDNDTEYRSVNETIPFGVSFENISGIVYPFGEWSCWDWYDGQYFGSDFARFDERPSVANTTELTLGVGFTGHMNDTGPNSGEVKFNITVGDWNVDAPGGRDVLEGRSLAVAFYSDLTMVTAGQQPVNATYKDDFGNPLSNNQTASSKKYTMTSGLSSIASMNLGGSPYIWSKNTSKSAKVDSQTIPVSTFSVMYESDAGVNATSFKVKSTQFYTLIGFKWWDGYKVSVDPVFVGYSTSQSADQIAPNVSGVATQDADPDQSSVTISTLASDLGGSGLSRVALYDITDDKETDMVYNPGTGKFEVSLDRDNSSKYTFRYTIRAYDGAGNMMETTQQTYDFYDIIDPEINSVNGLKISVLGEEAALVQVDVSDLGGSGLASVEITYTVDSVDTNEDMEFNSSSGYYEYTITDQSPGTVVTYTITVTDGDGNSITSLEHSYTFYLDEIAPTIHSAENYSIEVSGEPTIFIQANVSDGGESGIASVKLNYTIITYNGTTASLEYGTPVVVDMQWNSTSEFYEYIIPLAAAENATAVLYSVTVTDGHGNSVTSTEKVAYFVTGFDIPPIIGTPLLNPSSPRSWNAVNVSVTITDDHSIKNATLYYRIDSGSWQSIMMTKNGNTYNATIPAAPDGSIVTYYIEAYDNAGQKSILEESTYSVIDDQLTPEISDVFEVSVAPKSSESVVITATITDDIAIENATLYVKFNDGPWNELEMTNDGDVFEATIPAQPHGTEVIYYIQAYDTSGKSVTTTEYSYMVNDDTEVPVISSVSISIPAPSYLDSVTISAEVEDDLGLENVTLYFKVDDGEWITVQMEFSGGRYRAIIPAQGEGSVVTYFVRAYDTVGNSVDSASQSYTVIGERTTTGPITTTEIVIGRFTIGFGVIFFGMFLIGLLLVLRRRK
jgi:hypothetical protein